MLNWIKRLFKLKQKNTGNPFAITEDQADEIIKRVADSLDGRSVTSEFTPKVEPVWVSDAELAHHLRYIGRTGGFKYPDGSVRVPTPQEVVQAGWEPDSYLEQFNPAA
jgi:hypothetical protein